MIGYILPVHKDEEWTSHDAVQRLRSILRIREIGHAGSLDPFATGILLCGIGRGTKVLSYLLGLRKHYAGTMRLGRTTDSGDRTGALLVERPVGVVDWDRAQQIARSFLGTQEQIPPMISAVKQQGRRLYELAREGIEVERKPRTIEIHRFDLLDLSDDLLRFEVECGKGTYIRTLVQDFGERLGPGASVDQLARTAIGAFPDAEAVVLRGEEEEIREECRKRAMPLARALNHLPALTLQTEWVRRIRHGSQPPWRAVSADRLPEGDRFRLLGPEKELIAMASLEAIPGPVDRSWKESWELRLERVL